MQGRGVKFWVLWGITLLSFTAGCSANRRLTYCVAGSVDRRWYWCRDWLRQLVGIAMNIVITPCWAPGLALLSVALRVAC